ERHVVHGDDAAEPLRHALHREQRHRRRLPYGIHPTASRVQERLRERGLDVEVRELAESTRTAAEAAAAVGCDIGQIVKSLVFEADGRAFLALTSGPNRADPERLAELLMADEVRRADPEEARAATGYGIGGTPPFGHPTRLQVLMDRDLMGYDLVWAAAGSPDSVFPITPRDLLSAAEAEVADFKADPS
ncbi:MAG TPA: YbaK/EbsC family protein, partial [Actinomycetota bacterium]|nr:YbaK/EbsC family protein [Actinomycetota bacterium]